MSRIWKLPFVLPAKGEAKIEGTTIEVKGEKGALSFSFSPRVSVTSENNTLSVSPLDEDAKALWGTTRSVIANMVQGVSAGYTKSLEINGVGYKFEIQWQKLILSIGFSHKVELDIPSELKIQADEKLKNVIHISGIDKQKVGEFTSKVRSLKKPEPYKGKGIKYVGEKIRRKAGKTGSK